MSEILKNIYIFKFVNKKYFKIYKLLLQNIKQIYFQLSKINKCFTELIKYITLKHYSNHLSSNNCKIKR